MLAKQNVSLARTEIAAAMTEALAARADVASRAFYSISDRDFNAYDQMTATSAANEKDLQTKLRTDYFNHCGISLHYSCPTICAPPAIWKLLFNENLWW